MEELKIGVIYTFERLEKWFNENYETSRSLCLKVEHYEYEQIAIMHIFWENFCGDWLSGDGILFYEDGEAHSANPNDEFKLLDIISIK